jgi:hypothetical protein
MVTLQRHREGDVLAGAGIAQPRPLFVERRIMSAKPRARSWGTPPRPSIFDLSGEIPDLRWQLSGILKTARECRVGSSTVQPVKAAMAS